MPSKHADKGDSVAHKVDSLLTATSLEINLMQEAAGSSKIKVVLEAMCLHVGLQE